MEPETFYHVYNTANGWEQLFLKEENYRYFLQQWHKYISPIADTYCYCLMPNHFHFLIRTKPEEEVIKCFLTRKKIDLDSTQKSTLQGFETLGGLGFSFDYSKEVSLRFSHLFNGYSQAYNKMYKRKGSLFIPSFKRKEITEEKYLDAIIAYIHRNPVHHHYVAKMEDWNFSSYNSFLTDKPTKIKRMEIIDRFGGVEYFKLFHDQQVELLLNTAYSLE